MTEIKISTVRRSGPFVDYHGKAWPGLWSGRITVFEDRRRLWSKTYSAERVCVADALEDAEMLASDLAAQYVTP